ncbi:MAG: tRNA (adenosine(37)-N6)-threonylcarbamoyltransferase complex ATPase subunit type 1 TsaE [Acetanaerobacterium sp.]
MERILSHSTQETEAFALSFAKRLHPGDVIALRGGMGVGKTAFVRGLAQGLGVAGEVTSPTFALVHEHEGDIPLYHFDMYRVTSLDDLYSTGFFDYLDTGAVLVVEWSENIAGALPKGHLAVTLRRLSDTEREIIIEEQV